MEAPRELVVAQQIASQAGEIMLRYFDGDQQRESKDDGTLVTIADKAINHMVIEELGKAFPDDGVVGEEESSAEYGMGRRWICDPIDGTDAQVIGLPSAMFSLGFVLDGVPTAAVTYEPHLKRLYTAVQGQGSYLNGRKLEVSTDAMEDGLIAIAPDFYRSKYVDQTFVRRLLAYDKQLQIFPGAVFRSCAVANGRIAGFPHPAVKPYDIAAAHLIVEEAGGKVTDVHGNPLDYSKEFRGAIISNGVVHEDLMALFKD